MELVCLIQYSISSAYISAGTSLGDLIEIQGINEVFKGSHTLENPLVIGAGKSCVGHAELVAGLVGVLKTLGTFADETVPGLVQLNESNMNVEPQLGLQCGPTSNLGVEE